MRIRALLSAVALISVAPPALAEDRRLDFDRYGQSAAVMAAIASGVARVTPCSGPIEYFEEQVGEFVTLNIHCDGSEEDEANAIITFREYGDILVVEKFDYAG